MISGVHAIIYSRNPELDRVFLRDGLKMHSIDAGGGWLIFKLPPSEVAFHPTDGEEKHELYFMCDDITAFVKRMSDLNAHCTEIQEEGWGKLVQLTLPGGGKVGVYEPTHARPS
ncbi:MAG: extradiol dioxygenase [Bacteroidetes bacterium]|nr:extradiol dioxygenase [Bacteroidota bacterium]